MESHKINQKNLENIIILNEELKSFFNIIINTINIDNNINDTDSININFVYNNEYFDLYSDIDTIKLSITDKDTKYYECYYDNYAELLIKKIDFKTVNIDDIHNLFEQLIIL